MGTRGPKPGRKVGGRKKGTPNKRTAQRELRIREAAAAVASLIPGAFEGDSHALLMAIYKNPHNPIELRLDAAKAAIGYEKPRLAAVEHKGDKENPIGLLIVSGVPRGDEHKRPTQAYCGAAH